MKILPLLINTTEVTQLDLEHIVALDLQIQRLRKNRDLLATAALTKIIRGVEVEGGLRSYEVVEYFCGSTNKRRLVVK